jgi:hypothetical protein
MGDLWWERSPNKIRGLAAPETRCQTLGQALAEQTCFAGIRFPSDAARELGFEGFNDVLFKEAVASPVNVKVRNELGVLGPSWPL